MSTIPTQASSLAWVFSCSKRIELILPSQHGVILAIFPLLDHQVDDSRAAREQRKHLCQHFLANA